MKRKNIVTLVISMLASVFAFCEMPAFRLYVTAFVIWVACLLAEEHISTKTSLILLYIPVCMTLCNWPLLFLNKAIIGIIHADAVFMATGIVTELIGFGVFVLLLALRRRKKDRLQSPGFLVCTALAFCICALLAWQECAMWLSPEFVDPLLPRLRPYIASELRGIVRMLLYYLPTLGILLSRQEKQDTATN